LSGEEVWEGHDGGGLRREETGNDAIRPGDVDFLYVADGDILRLRF